MLTNWIRPSINAQGIDFDFDFREREKKIRRESYIVDVCGDGAHWQAVRYGPQIPKYGPRASLSFHYFQSAEYRFGVRRKIER